LNQIPAGPNGETLKEMFPLLHEDWVQSLAHVQSLPFNGGIGWLPTWYLQIPEVVRGVVNQGTRDTVLIFFATAFSLIVLLGDLAISNYLFDII